MLKSEFYIVFKARKNSWGWSLAKGAPRTTIKKPSLGVDEVAIKAEIEIPTHHFERPMLKVTGALPDLPTKESKIQFAKDSAALIEQSLGLKIVVEN